MTSNPPSIYRIEAHWPNSTVQPEIHRRAHYADALDLCIILVKRNKHTIISVTTPDGMELMRFWGMVEGLP